MEALSFSVAKWGENHRRACAPVRVTAPKQLTSWTRTSVSDGNRYVYADQSGLLPYHEPTLPTDLNAGYPKDYIKKDDSVATHIDPVIEACNRISVDLTMCDVCTFRNNLNKICLTVLDLKQAWTVDACQLHPHSPLFLDIVKTDDGRSFPDSDLFTYYGYKFESLCTGGGPVDSTSEFATVVKYTLGELRVVMAAEIDCFDPDVLEEGSQDCSAAFVELKTFRMPTTASFDAKMKAEKFPRWWVQSFLGGVRYMALGGRDKEGVLRQVRKVRVIDLPAESAEAGVPWDPWRLIKFGADVLKWMRECAASHPGVHLRFTYSPSTQAVEVQELPEGDLPGRLRGLLGQGA